MNRTMLCAFSDELEKIARVPGAVKMYRRVMGGLETSLRSMKGGANVPREGFAAHGTEDLAGILDEGRIHASSLGETGQHGGGVYWWKGFPREHYLKGPEAEGVLSNLETLPSKKPMMANIHSGHHNPHAVRTGPEDYKLQPKDYAVIDTAGRTQNKTIGPVMADAAKNKTRVVDSAIFDRAMKDFRDGNMRASGKVVPGASASNDHLTGLLERRRAGEF